jgi:hypothetical protein
MGCGQGVSSGISWAFENEDRLIFLDDDCVPENSFFKFCNYCLEKYKDDNRVMTVNGRSHHSDHPIFKNNDYIFSKYAHCWGWATWKRVWNYFDISMKLWPKFYAEGGFSNSFLSIKESKFLNKKYETLFHDTRLKQHSWAYPFSFNLMSNGALNITPAKNLIKNVGLTGVHSNGRLTKVHSLEASHSFVYDKDPSFVLSNREYDLYHFENHVREVMGRPPIHKRVINKLLRLIGLR